MQSKKNITNKFIFLTATVFILFFSFNSLALAASSNCTPTPDPNDNDDCKYAGQKCVEQDIGGEKVFRCARALEIIYPGTGPTVPTTVAAGIPEYFKYIFQLAVIAIGLVIFGVLIYNGAVLLITAPAGNPSKLADAKTGITSALLGTVILLSAYLIFNTVNPQLTVLSLPSVNILEQVVSAGVYVCNYQYTGNSLTSKSIGDILSEYISKEGEEQNEVVREMQSVIVNPDNRNQTCQKANFSGNFQNFVVKDNYTMFIVPSISYSLNVADNKYEKKPEYDFGVILHEKDDYRGKCKIYPEDYGTLFYTQTTIDSEGRKIIGDEPYPATHNNPVPDYVTGTLGFNDARSITVFKRPAAQPGPGALGLKMYMCLDSDRIGCPEFINPANPGSPNYTTGEPPNFLPQVNLDALSFGLVGDVSPSGYGTRSVTIDPKDLIFSVFRDDENNCARITRDNPDISNIDIKKCDAGAGPAGGTCTTNYNFLFLHWGGTAETCVPCIQQVDVIKGQVL